ncbi:MAG: cytochrome c [Chlamydiales bacterium]|jgi:cytochrome c
MNIRFPICLSLLSLPIALSADLDEAQILMHKGTCTSCHHPMQRRMGPSFQETADKYAGNSDVRTKLFEVIRSGSENGRMPGNKRLSDEEIDTMVDWILALSHETSDKGRGKS